MPISNSIYKGKSLFASEFFCPNCFVVRPYEIKQMSMEIIFHAIPFLDRSEAEHVVVCQACHEAFDPDVLQRNIQSLLKLAGAAKYQLDQGISPGFLKLKLISDGLNEGFADSLISLALH